MSKSSYIPQEFELKWRKSWEDEKVYQVEEDKNIPKYYCLDMFPYPSGSGLHVGHWRGYVLSDVWSRYKMLADLEKLDWPERTKKMQREWIGRSEGAEIEFELRDELAAG